MTKNRTLTERKEALRITNYILDENRQPVPEPDLRKWAYWYSEANRHVACEQVGDLQISTVFLGIDHGFGCDGPPILYETMVFNQSKDNIHPWREIYMERCATWDEAVEMHQRAIQWVKEQETAA